MFSKSPHQMRYTEEKEKYLNTNFTKAFVKLLAFDQKK